MTRTLVTIAAILAASFVLDPVAAEHGGDCGGDVIIIAELVYDDPDIRWY